MICPFCQHTHDNEGDRYGCPNCHGKGLDNMSDINKDIDDLFCMAAWVCLAAVGLMWFAGWI